MDALRNAQKELKKEINKQIITTYAAAAIAFYEAYGYRKKKIKRIFDLSEELWDEIATAEDSAISQLYDETGVVLGAEGVEKDFFDLDYLDPEKYKNIKNYSRPMLIRLVQQQKKWTASLITATILLAMRRYYAWGADRLIRLVEEINKVKVKYNMDEKKLKDAAEALTKVEIALHD